MKVLYISAHEPQILKHRATVIESYIRHMPCDLVECHNQDDVERHISDADVVLLRHCWDSLDFLNSLPVYIGRFYVDMWRRIPVDIVEPDAIIVAYRGLVEEYQPAWLNETLFWSPPCFDVQSYDLPRDIDIVFWGTVTGAYPFRMFVLETLRSMITRTVAVVDPYLTIYEISLAGNKYTLAIVRFISAVTTRTPNPDEIAYGYYGARLHRLLSRSKICVTGPPESGAAVGRYFENAACGVVTLSEIFTDNEELGFIDTENIFLTSEQLFIDDLESLLTNENAVNYMSTNARKLIQERHTPAIRGRQLYDFLCKETGKT